MSGKTKHWVAASATPWDNIPEDELDPSQKLVAQSHRSAYAFRHERFDGDIEFMNSYRREACPHCGGIVSKNGKDKTGLQRYRCSTCGRTFTPATGTIFESRKLPLSAWSDFLVQIFSYASTSLMTREDRRSATTTPYWMGKLFTVLDGIQDGIMLANDVWIDETYMPEIKSKLIRKPDGKLPRGLSKNQYCIGIGVDKAGHSIYALEGMGKTSSAKTWAAFGDRIVPGSKLIHDMEYAHRCLVRDLNLVSEMHNGKLLKGVPDELDPLHPVSQLCFLLQMFLRTHSGFDRKDLQGYLDLFYVIANEPNNKLEKAALVLDRAMCYPKSLRFRSFYNINSSSNE